MPFSCLRCIFADVVYKRRALRSTRWDLAGMSTFTAGLEIPESRFIARSSKRRFAPVWASLSRAFPTFRDLVYYVPVCVNVQCDVESDWRITGDTVYLRRLSRTVGSVANVHGLDKQTSWRHLVIYPAQKHRHAVVHALLNGRWKSWSLVSSCDLDKHTSRYHHLVIVLLPKRRSCKSEQKIGRVSTRGTR